VDWSRDDYATIWLGSTYNSGYGYSSWFTVDADFAFVKSTDINLSATDIVLSGNLYVDRKQSGYQGITGSYWSWIWGSDWNLNQPLYLNFRNGICVDAHY
jgi:hypothetical protein